MAETQKATVGYAGEFWLNNGTTLIELVQVKSFKIPEPGSREQIETTHLKSPDWHREYVSGFYEDSDFEVVFNYRALSTTDTTLSAMLASDATRAFLAVIPEAGAPAAQVEGTVRLIGYDRGTVTPDGVIEATATFRVVTVEDVAAYEEPA